MVYRYRAAKIFLKYFSCLHIHRCFRRFWTSWPKRALQGLSRDQGGATSLGQQRERGREDAGEQTLDSEAVPWPVGFNLVIQSIGNCGMSATHRHQNHKKLGKKRSVM